MRRAVRSEPWSVPLARYGRWMAAPRGGHGHYRNRGRRCSYRLDHSTTANQTLQYWNSGLTDDLEFDRVAAGKHSEQANDSMLVKLDDKRKSNRPCTIDKPRDAQQS